MTAVHNDTPSFDLQCDVSLSTQCSNTNDKTVNVFLWSCAPLQSQVSRTCKWR